MKSKLSIHCGGILPTLFLSLFFVHCGTSGGGENAEYPMDGEWRISETVEVSESQCLGGFLSAIEEAVRIEYQGTGTLFNESLTVERFNGEALTFDLVCAMTWLEDPYAETDPSNTAYSCDNPLDGLILRIDEEESWSLRGGLVGDMGPEEPGSGYTEASDSMLSFTLGDICMGEGCIDSALNTGDCVQSFLISMEHMPSDSTGPDGTSTPAQTATSSR